MSVLINLINQRFGRLVALGIVGRCNFGQALWRCQCDCGEECIVRGRDLRVGHSKSCGCLVYEHEGGQNLFRHGDSGTRLHNIWCGMKQRTADHKARDFHNYGGRGIRVCAEWLHDFVAFRDWALANGYADHLTIDRWPDNDGNYEPNNCRWATPLEQNRNRRPSRRREVQIASHR